MYGMRRHSSSYQRHRSHSTKNTLHDRGKTRRVAKEEAPTATATATATEEAPSPTASKRTRIAIPLIALALLLLVTVAVSVSKLATTNNNTTTRPNFSRPHGSKNKNSSSSSSSSSINSISTMSSEATTGRSTRLLGASSSSARIRSIVEHLRDRVGINFLALDFDQTILDIHTGGNWRGSLEELFPHVRPLYSQLILEALDAGLEVAVVTFSCQIRFVRGVLDHIVGGANHNHNNNNNNSNNSSNSKINNHHTDTSHKIPIRGGDRSWVYKGLGSLKGKQPHMASAVEELEARRAEEHSVARQRGGNTTTTTATGGTSSSSTSTATPPEPAPITRKTTLLLDDDARNIQHALRNGTRAVWFNPKRPDLLLPELAELV